MSLEQMAVNLSISPDEIKKYAKNHWKHKEKYKKLFLDKTPEKSSLKISGFSLKDFIADNINIFILLTVLVSIVYVNSLGNDFVSDDIPAIPKNETLGNFSAIFNPFPLGSVQHLIHFIAFHLGGKTPFFFRIFNFAFHAGSVFLVFSILNLISKRRIAVLTAILFAVHPILSESVAWISGMPYPLAAFLFLLSFFLFIIHKNNPSKKILIISYVSFFLAVITNEKIMPMILVFIIFDWIYGNFKKDFKKILPYVGLVLMELAMLIPRFSQRIESTKIDNYQTETNHSVFIKTPVAVGNYLKLLFWPDKLSLYHTEMSYNYFQYFLFILVFLAFLGIIFWGFKKNKLVFFWLSFFLIALSVTLTPLRISWIVAERYVYLGSIGIFAVVAMFFDWFLEKYSRQKNIIYAIFAIIIISLSSRTIIRNMDWKNEDTLWVATAKVSPSGYVIHNNLGDMYDRQKNPDKAIEEFKKAIEINPRYAEAYHNLANTYQRNGQIDLAIENYQKAIEFSPNLWQSYQNLASIYFDQGDYPKAKEFIQKALKVDPNNQNLQDLSQVIQSKVGN